jgi:PIN domain
MTKQMLLVDFENIQKVDLSNIPNDTSVFFVLGAMQKNVPTELAMQAQALGDRFTYVSIKEVQPNAVDICIAFYLGEYLAKKPTAECVILSKDKKAFDPLVRHLTVERGFRVRRANAQKDAFSSVTPNVAKQDAFLRAIELLGKEKSLPLKRTGLEGKVKSYFPKLSANERRALLDRLFAEGRVSESGSKLRYSLLVDARKKLPT